MYELTIVTKYNTIKLQVEDYASEEVQEIISQPYVVSVDMTKIDNKNKPNIKVRKRDYRDNGTKES